MRSRTSTLELLEQRQLLAIDTLSPVADALVRDGSYQTTNFGTEATLTTKHLSAAGYNRDSYLRFNVASITEPVEQATLRIYVTATGPTSVTGYLSPVTNDSWGETTITWNNKPTKSGSIASFAPAANTWVEIDVTSHVANRGDNLLSFALTASADSNGEKWASFTSREGAADKRPQLVIQTTAPNQAPIANNDGPYNLPISGQITISAAGVLTNDSDPEGNPLTAVKLTNPAHGTVTLNANGSFTYQATAGYEGTDSFTYRAYDGAAYSAAATVSFNISSTPLASADDYTTPKSQTLNIAANAGVLQNDWNPASGSLSAALVVGPAHGTLTLNTDGSFSYQPDAGYVGLDSFTYTASNSTHQSAPATVTLHVINRPPQATPDVFQGDLNQQLVIPANQGVLQNDTDPDSDALSAVLAAQAQHGTVTLNSDGSFTYTPATGFVGQDSFTYRASDGSLQSPPTAVSIAVNAPPTAEDDDYVAVKNQTLSIEVAGVLANDSDPEQNALTVQLVADAQHGTVVLNADGTFSYTPNAGYYGPDYFTYTASDGRLSSASTTVSLNVLPFYQEISTQPVADAYVRGGSYANTNFGTEPTLVAKNESSPDYNRDSYLRFDLSNFHGQALNATLRVYVAAVGPLSSTGYLSSVANDTWGETTITWNNKPAKGGQWASFTPVDDAWVEIDVTALVNGRADDLLSFAITSSPDIGGSVWTTYASREGSASVRPELVLKGAVHEGRPSVSIDNVSVQEGETGEFTVSLSGPSAETIVVGYAAVAAGVGAGFAVKPDDYGLPSGSVSIAPGDTSGKISFTTVNDAADEPNEVFHVNLTVPSNATAGSSLQGVGTIVDNDVPPPAITLSDVTITEGDSEHTTADFLVSLDAPAPYDITITYKTTSGTATGGQDYTTSTTGTLVIAEGDSSGVISIPILNDEEKECTEHFYVEIVSAVASTGSLVVPAPAEGKILDDDTISITTRSKNRDPLLTAGLYTFLPVGTGVVDMASGIYEETLAKPDCDCGCPTSGACDSGNDILEVRYQSGPCGAPDEVEIILNFADRPSQTVKLDTSALATGEELFAQFELDKTGLNTGVYDYTFTIIEHFSSETQQRTFSDKIGIVNTEDSNYGFNRTLPDLDQIIETAEGVMLVFGNAMNAVFTALGDGLFATPAGSFSTLTETRDSNGQLTGYVNTQKTGRQDIFNAQGMLTERRGPDGTTKFYSYTDADDDGVEDELATFTDPLGRVATYAYNSAGLLSTITDHAGRVTSYEYDGDRRLTTTTSPDPDGAGPEAALVTEYEYYASHQLKKIIEPGGKTTEFVYGDAGRITEIIHHDGTRDTFVSADTQALVDPNAVGLIEPTLVETLKTTHTGPRGKITEYTTDRFGLVISLTNAEGHTWTFERDANGLVTRMTEPDPDGAGPLSTLVTEYDYDAKGNVLQAAYADGTFESWTYNPVHSQVSSHTNALGRTAYFDVACACGRLFSATYVVGQLDSVLNGETNDIKYSYTYPDSSSILPKGLVLTATDPLGRVTKYTYFDDPGQLTFGLMESMTVAFGTADAATVYFEYNAAGARTALIDELGRRTDYTYDALDRLRKIELPSPTSGDPRPTTVLEYDAHGRLFQVTDPLGNVVEYEFDSMDRTQAVNLPSPTGVGAPTGPRIEYDYDAAGNLVEWTDALGRKSSLRYDDLGRVDQTTGQDPNSLAGTAGPQANATYDAAGNLKTSTDALGRTTEYFYDARHRLIKIVEPFVLVEGDYFTTPTTHYAYDAAGQLTSVTDPKGRITSYEYDVVGRLVKTTLPAPTGGISHVAETTAYDKAGNVVSQTDSLGNVTSFVYDARNRLVQVTQADPDGVGPQTAPITLYVYDDASQLTSVTDPLGRVTSYEYDNLGRTVAVVLPDPDGAGPLAAPSTTFTYDLVGNLLSETDPLGNVTDYEYDNLYRLIQVLEADPDGAGPLARPETTYVYDAAGQLTSMTDPLGRVTSYEYDLLGRQTKVTLPDPDGAGSQLAPWTTFTYDLVGNLLSSTNRLGHTTSYFYDGLNRRTRETDANGDSTYFGYDLVGNLTSLTDPVDNTTTWAYDGLDRATRETNELGHSRNFVYDDQGNLTAKIDRNGRVVRYDYDHLHRRVAEIAGSPIVGRHVFYNNSGLDGENVAANEDDAQAIAADKRALLPGETASFENITSYTSGINGVMIDLVDLPGVAVTAADFEFRVGDDADPGAWSAAPAPLSITVSAGAGEGGSDRITIIWADEAIKNEWLQVTLKATANTGLATPDVFYFGNLVGEVGNSSTEAVVEEADAQEIIDLLIAQAANSTSGPAAVYSPYDVNRSGAVTALDALLVINQFSNVPLADRTLTLFTAPGSSVQSSAYQYAYDAVGQLLSVAGSGTQYDYSYDNLGRVVETTQQIAGLAPTVTFASAYDLAGNRTSLAASLGSTADFDNEYQYDHLHRLTKITQQGQSGGNSVADKRIDFSYDAAGQRDQITRFADLAGTKLVATTDFSFDLAGRLTGMAHAQGATSLVSHTWQYDVANRLTQYVNSIDGTVDYNYDDRDQLVGADYDYQADEDYAYDENGNRLTAGGSSYTTGANNQLLSDGVYEYEYDYEGNRTRRIEIATGATTVYTWDHRNRLVAITDYADEIDADLEQNALKIVEHAYDAFNQWTRRTVDPDGDAGSTAIDKTFFLYENGQINLQFDKTGSGDATASDLSHRYLWSNAVDQLLADEDAAGDVIWPLTDHLGTTRDLAEYHETTDTTSIASHRTFNAFGELTSETGAATIVFGFTGRVFDITTGLQNNLNRWYDFRTGRWISEDPIGFAAGDANINRYISNRTTNNRDPFGLFDEELFWRNVDLLSPDVRQWFQNRGGQLHQGNIGFLWWGNVQGGWTNNSTTPYIWLEKDFSEVEASIAFIDKVQNSLEFGTYYHGARIASTCDPDDAATFSKWWYKHSAAAVVSGVEAYLAVLSIANEGADWVITANEVKENFSSGQYLAAAFKTAGFLPFISGGMVRIAYDVGETIRVPNAVRHFLRTGQLGRGFESYEALVKYLRPAGKNHSWHHLVQQHDTNVARFGSFKIQNECNVIALPNELHAEITKIQNSIDVDITGSPTLTVRDWVARMSYEEQWAFGQKLLENVMSGVW